MSAHNLAVVLVPTLFQSMSQDLLKLTREFIIHHTLLFLVNTHECRDAQADMMRQKHVTLNMLQQMPKGDVTVEAEEQITAF